MGVGWGGTRNFYTGPLIPLLFMSNTYSHTVYNTVTESIQHSGPGGISLKNILPRIRNKSEHQTSIPEIFNPICKDPMWLQAFILTKQKPPSNQLKAKMN